MSRTRFALWLYYLAISFLTICAIVIVVKLIVFPPCAPRGNTCVVDPWSAAGLEGAVLGVSATVLAILGAVAVAGWWTSLTERVKDQVGVLYDAQKKEVNTQVDGLVREQQKKVDAQIAEFGTKLDSIQQDVGRAKALAEQVSVLTERANEILRQTTERSEQETELLQQSNNRAAELLTNMQDLVTASQQRAATMNDTYKHFREALGDSKLLEAFLAMRKKGTPESETPKDTPTS